jgi:very-short-patch-repair endonuclease
VRSGRLERIATGVYRLCGVPDSWHQRLLAATLAGPPGTVASHRSAAALHGFRGFGRDVVEVSSTRWRRARLPDVRVHESLAVPADDAVVTDGIPVTTPTRTVIDLGAVSHPFKIGRALDEARRTHQIELGALKRRLEELAVQGRNGIVAVRRLVDERAGVPLASTGFEQLLFRLTDDFNLPRPRGQHKVRTTAGEFYLDFAYVDQRVAIELDSEEYHLDLEQFHRDRERQNVLVLLGWRFLRFTSRHLRQNRAGVAGQIASAIRGSSPT